MHSKTESFKNLSCHETISLSVLKVSQNCFLQESIWSQVLDYGHLVNVLVKSLGLMISSVGVMHYFHNMFHIIITFQSNSVI